MISEFDKDFIKKVLQLKKFKTKGGKNMFQNITNDIQEENKINAKSKWSMRLKNILHINDIILYIISFMLSTVSFHSEFAPFGLAIFAAATSNKIATGFIFVAVALRNFN